MMAAEYKIPGPRPKKIAFALGGVGINGGTAVVFRHIMMLIAAGHAVSPYWRRGWRNSSSALQSHGNLTLEILVKSEADGRLIECASRAGTSRALSARCPTVAGSHLNRAIL
jgi:hypothetical protein